MQIDPGTRLLELGKEFSKARRLFRRLGIEIDLQTQLTVADACDQAGISFKDLTRTLVAMTPGKGTARSLDDWAEAPIAELVRHIQDRHHTFTRQELARLEPLLNQAVAQCAEQYPELAQIRIHFHNLKDDLLKHLDTEDNIIFPSIVGEGEGPAFTTLDDLHRMALKEHDAAEELFQNIGVITRNFSLPLGAPPVVRSVYLGLRDLEEDLFMHIYLENHLLFPRSLQEDSSNTSQNS